MGAASTDEEKALETPPHPLPAEEDPWDDEDFEIHTLMRDESPAQRRRDRVGFTVGVVNLVATAYMMGGVQWAMPLFYSIKFPTLVGLRFFMYRRIGYQWFLIDLCYFCNAALLVYLWIMPESSELFMMVYSLTHGPLTWAVILFHNSLVFHSVDKITSLLIHLTPPLVTHCIRWYTPWTSPIYTVPSFVPEYSSSLAGAQEILDSDGPFMWLILAPILFVVGHQALYFMVVQILPNKKLKSDRTMLTTYRVVTRNHKSIIWKLVNCCGRPGRVINFFLMNLTYCAISLALAPIWFNNYWADFGVLVLAATISVWNGAGYYIEHFAHKYKFARGKENMVPAVPL